MKGPTLIHLLFILFNSGCKFTRKNCPENKNLSGYPQMNRRGGKKYPLCGIKFLQEKKTSWFHPHLSGTKAMYLSKT